MGKPMGGRIRFTSGGPRCALRALHPAGPALESSLNPFGFLRGAALTWAAAQDHAGWIFERATSRNAPTTLQACADTRRYTPPYVSCRWATVAPSDGEQNCEADW